MMLWLLRSKIFPDMSWQSVRKVSFPTWCPLAVLDFNSHDPLLLAAPGGNDRNYSPKHLEGTGHWGVDCSEWQKNIDRMKFVFERDEAEKKLVSFNPGYHIKALLILKAIHLVWYLPLCISMIMFTRAVGIFTFVLTAMPLVSFLFLICCCVNVTGEHIHFVVEETLKCMRPILFGFNRLWNK